MPKYLKEFDNIDGYNTYINGNPDLPNVSLIDNTREVKYKPRKPKYSKRYLTFVASENGSFSFTKNIEYSTDNGSTWTTLASGTSTPTIASGDTIMWKGELTPTTTYGVGTFSSTGRYDVEGNVMSLLFGDNFVGQTDLTDKQYALATLFSGNTGLTSAENLVLPATTLVNHCYSQMFRGCTSLTTSPELPATTLEHHCYMYMFYQCTSLTKAPELPATTLPDGCYMYMFYSCPSLEKAPELPTTTLANGCYYWMFYGCVSLNYIKMLATDISATNCLTNWVEDVSPTGTFVKAASQTSLPTGKNGIPDGWEVENI